MVALPDDQIPVAIDDPGVELGPALRIVTASDVPVDILELDAHHGHGRPNWHCIQLILQKLRCHLRAASRLGPRWQWWECWGRWGVAVRGGGGGGAIPRDRTLGPLENCR
jgi:hypothetical protein